MSERDYYFKLSELTAEVKSIKSELEEIRNFIKPEDELWDNSDLIRNWKVSERTLANWRKDGIIEYNKIKGKIYYSKQNRDKLLENSLIKN